MTSTAPSHPAASSPESRLLSRPHLPFALGAVALVTLAAFEDRAVGTALPSMVEDFHALAAFGLANAAPVASYVVALAAAGLWADRRGPVPVLRLGALAFAAAQLLVGTAPSMGVVVAGRLLSGLAEGLLDIALMVLVARVLPAPLRPRMFSLFAAAWVLPSVLGPVLTGVVTEQVGWRWVFLGALGLLVPTWLLLRPAVRLALRRPGAPDAQPTSRGLLGWALVASLSVLGLTLAGEAVATHRRPALAALAGAAVVLGWSVLHLVPRGAVRAERGFPTVVALRALTGGSFGVASAFLPLLLTLLHGFRPATAGVSLSVTGVMWAVGSWLQGRDHALPRAVLLRIGLGLITAGLLGTSLLVADLPPWLGLAGWAVAGVGMGLTSSSLSVLTLDLSGDEEQGRNNGAAQVAASTSTAMAFAGGGALLALAAPTPGPGVFAVILLAAVAAALLGLLLSGRVVPGPAERPDADDRSRAGGRARAGALEPATSSCG